MLERKGKEITFEDAKNYKLAFGKHQGKTLDQIASTDEGLRYLDWLVDVAFIQTKAHIKRYLEEPVIKKELERVTGD